MTFCGSARRALHAGQQRAVWSRSRCSLLADEHRRDRGRDQKCASAWYVLPKRPLERQRAPQKEQYGFSPNEIGPDVLKAHRTARSRSSRSPTKREYCRPRTPSAYVADVGSMVLYIKVKNGLRSGGRLRPRSVKPNYMLMRPGVSRRSSRVMQTGALLSDVRRSAKCRCTPAMSRRCASRLARVLPKPTPALDFDQNNGLVPERRTFPTTAFTPDNITERSSPTSSRHAQPRTRQGAVRRGRTWVSTSTRPGRETDAASST
jgi:hypothetical protein